MRFFLTILTFSLMVLGPAVAQSDREAELRRVTDNLNSIDPIKRVVALEEAMAAKDPLLRAIAIRTAMASSDVTLRSVALSETIKTKSTLILKITGFKDDGDSNSRYLIEHTPGSLDLVISDLNAETGDFYVHSSFSSLRSEKNGKMEPRKEPANFSGDRLSFTLNIGNVLSTYDDHVCRGTTHLKEGSSLLTGTMNCLGYGNYDIEIDLQR